MQPVQCSGAGGIEHLPVLGMTVGAVTGVVYNDRFELQTFGEIGGYYESARMNFRWCLVTKRILSSSFKDS